MYKGKLLLMLLSIVLPMQLLGQLQSCQGPLNVTVVGSLSGDQITISPTTSDVYCSQSKEGTISLTVEGGTPTYQCMWSHDTITTDIATELAPGNYQVTVTDMNGCKKIDTMDIVFMDPILDSLSLIDNPGCGMCFLHDGGSSYFYDNDEYIASVLDLETSIDLGNTQVCVDMGHPEPTTVYGDPILNRCWSIISDSVENSDFRLFFTNDELEELAQRSGYSDAQELLNSYNLYVMITTLTSDGSYPPTRQIDYGFFTITMFDQEKDVWSLELYGIENAKIELAVASSALPVELLSFDGSAHKGYNHLYWKTGQEVNTKEFEIERSKQGVEFETIGKVDAGASSYTFNDNDPYLGSSYYRLRIVDHDGTYKHSHIIRLEQKVPFSFEVINNPFTDRLFLEIDTGENIDAIFSIVSINGQKAREIKRFIDRGSSNIELQLDDLISGNYIITMLNTNTKETISRKIIKI